MRYLVVALAAFCRLAPGAAALETAGARFLAPGDETAGDETAGDETAGLAVAARGEARHAAFAGYRGEHADQVAYAHCQSGCDDAANWDSLRLDLDGAIKVQLALTPAGAPRLLVESLAPEWAGGRRFTYAECDASCLDAGNWRLGVIADSADSYRLPFNTWRLTDHSFRLDAQGRPRFVYADANEYRDPAHVGGFYGFCDADCTRRENWAEVELAARLETRTDLLDGESPRVKTDGFYQPVLALGPDGRVGVLAHLYPLDADGNYGPDALYYFACDGDCGERASWSRSEVLGTGGGSTWLPSWDLAFGRDGRPRAAFFAGEGMAQEDLSGQLIYFWCAGGDCDDAANWSGNVLGVGAGQGQTPDLELDANDAPRIAAMTEGGELALLWCDRDCDGTAGAWDAAVVEPAAVVAADRPVARAFSCDGELWQGQAPRLALADSALLIGYDVVVSARCYYKGPDQIVPSTEMNEVWHGTRILSTAVP